MILALKILLPLLEKHESELEEYIRVPDTWYLNSGVFSEFLDRNNLYLFHTYKYKEREEIEKEFQHIEEKFRHAAFPRWSRISGKSWKRSASIPSLSVPPAFSRTASAWRFPENISRFSSLTREISKVGWPNSSRG